MCVGMVLKLDKLLLPPFLNISHIVFSMNINARLGEVRGTKEKKENYTRTDWFPSSLDTAYLSHER